MLKKKDIKTVKAIILFFLLVIFMLPGKVLADNSLRPPSGLNLDKLFKTAYSAHSKVVKSENGDAWLVQITDDVTFRRGAIWSTDMNTLNLKEDFSSTMYLYFGNKGKLAADGITFVLHNDPNGADAIGKDGQTIGAWRYYNPTLGWLDTDTSIKNSIAIEFDTYYNKNDTNKFNFDYSVPSNNSKGTNHIAWNYPDKPATYSIVGGRQTMVHKDIQFPGWLSDDNWHTLNIKWTAASSNFMYQFDNMPAINIPINVNDIFKSNEVYWGFTGSTGWESARNHVAFDEIPGLVNAKVDLEIEDSTGASVIGKSVPGHSKLTYKYNSEYFSGKQAWQNIKFMTTIDPNVDYVPNSLKFIDKDNNVTVIPDSQWQTGSYLETLLADMDLTQNKGQLCFDVKTKKVSSSKTVTEKAEYKGSNLILRTAPQSYTINTSVRVGMDQQAELKKVTQADTEYVTSLTAVADDEVIFRNSLTLSDQAVGKQEYAMSFKMPTGVDYQTDSLKFDGREVSASDIISTDNGIIKFYLPEMAADPSDNTYEITLTGKLQSDLSDVTATSKFEIYDTANKLVSNSNNVSINVPKQEYGKVIFYYKEKGTNKELLNKKELVGKVGASYPEELPATITDYDHVSTDGNTKGVFELTPQTVTFWYEEDLGDIQLISYPKLIDFGTIPVKDYQKPIGVDGANLFEGLIVQDTRKVRNEWELTALVTQELTNDTDVQTGALRYVYNDKELQLDDSEKSIYYNDGKTSDTLYTISDTWKDAINKDGLKIRLTSNRVPNVTGSYEGVIKWNLKRTKY